MNGQVQFSYKPVAIHPLTNKRRVGALIEFSGVYIIEIKGKNLNLECCSVYLQRLALNAPY
jgi:hypothetical protein